jgi:acetolactate synthase-1/2/3 large subunit
MTPSRADWLSTLSGRDDEREEEIEAMAAAPMAGDQPYLNPLRLCQSIEKHLSDRAILIGDGGDFVATAAYTVRPPKPYSWLDPGVFGTLGVGAGFALGAKLVNPDADVWLLYGDGAAGFSIMEYDTFVRHDIPVIAVIGNDAGWTQIERDQVVVLDDDVACRLAYTDYHVVAQGCGAHGLVVSEQSELDATFHEALEVSRAGKPVLVNALMGKTDFRKGSISI